MRCPQCHAPIPQDFSLCPNCHYDPVATKNDWQQEEIRERHRATLAVWGEFIIAISLGVGILCHLMFYTWIAKRADRDRFSYLPWVGVMGTAFTCQAATIGAKMKNRHWAWGLLGLLSALGTFAVFCISRKCTRCSRLHRGTRPYCSECLY